MPDAIITWPLIHSCWTIYFISFSCRRFLKLDAVILPPQWNKTFIGFLHRIEVTCCNLSRVESHTFAHVEGLQALDLSQNQISHLSEESFSGLTSLLTINLENNLLSTLPVDLFQGLSNLENILLQGNLLTSIDATTFLNLHSLKRIDLSKNQIRHISEEAMGREYSYFTEFTQIDLSQNELTEFPVWLLQLKFLTDINLSYNRISFEGLKLVLSKMPSASFISDANRQITSTTDNFFLPATMKTIKLQNNEFTTIDISQLEEEEWYNFQLLLNYFHLDFDGNVLHCDCNVHALYDYLRSSDTAEPRDHNEIGVLPENLISITCQHPANLQGIPLGRIPVNSLGCYQEVPGCPRECKCWVRTIDEAVKVICRNNSLTRLPENLPYNTVELDFSGNSLASLPQDIPNYFSYVDVINLSENVLHSLGGWFFEVLGNTTQLHLQGNQLTTLPAEVRSEDKIRIYCGFLLLPNSFLLEENESYTARSVPWLLMVWHHDGTRQLCLWYWPRSPEIFRSQHHVVHIKAETKWPSPSRRYYFRTHFLD